MKKQRLPFLSIVKYFSTTLMLSGLLIANNVIAQKNIDTSFIPSGKLWGLAYGDYAFKINSDPLNRGVNNQYTGIKKNESLFQFRRIYLGYDYEISKRFSANFLLAHEENEVATASSTPTTTGDLLTNNKSSLFIKLANVTWKNIFKGSNLSFGQVYTPSTVLLADKVWDYRCIERTISDIRRTPHYDFGFKLDGVILDKDDKEIGYNLMVGNGTAAKPENDMFKWFYGDIYTKLFDKKLIIDLYADYTRINWVSNWHHDRSMLKGLIAYSTPKFTIGTEAFTNTIRKDNVATKSSLLSDTIDTKSSCISIFSRGQIYKNILGFFVRYDNYNPTSNNNNIIYTTYSPINTNYNPNTKEEFFTIGLDYSPIPQIHIMPNIWYNKYINSAPAAKDNGEDVVLRLSFYYIYGK